MANIQRPLKTFGTRTYEEEVAAAPGNKAPILSAEVDGDLNLIYEAWNNGVTGDDIAPGSVGTNQLAPGAVTSEKILDGTIQLADMGSNSVDSSKIVDGSIQLVDMGPNSVNSSKIVDGSILVGDLGAGASIVGIGRHRRQGETIDITNRTESTYLTLSIAARSASVAPAGLLVMRARAFGLFSIAGTDGVVGLRLYRDGVNFDVIFMKGQGDAVPWTVYYEDLITIPDTNAHTYRVDVYSTNATAILHGGSLFMTAHA